MSTPNYKKRSEEKRKRELIPLGDGTFGHDLGFGSIEKEKTVSDTEKQINTAARKLFRALCNDKDLPREGDDLLVDYIFPTREYRLGLAMELNETQRINAHNKAHFAIELLEDWIEQLDKADKTLPVNR